MKLSNRQKSVLAQLARKAWNHLAEQSAERGESFDTGHEAHNEWRRQEVRKACGRHGLSEAENKHYNSIAAHFENLIGNDGRAFNHLMREQSEGFRQVQVVLRRALGVGDLPEDYAETIALTKFGCPVEDLSENQLWQIVYTVKERVRARQRRESGVVA